MDIYEPLFLRVAHDCWRECKCKGIKGSDAHRKWLQKKASQISTRWALLLRYHLLFSNKKKKTLFSLKSPLTRKILCVPSASCFAQPLYLQSGEVKTGWRTSVGLLKLLSRWFCILCNEVVLCSYTWWNSPSHLRLTFTGANLRLRATG